MIAFIQRINAELAAAREQWRRDRYRKALRRKRIILPKPQYDERSSIDINRRINTP